MSAFLANEVPAMPIICLGCGEITTPLEAEEQDWSWGINSDDPKKGQAPICPQCQEIARFRP